MDRADKKELRDKYRADERAKESTEGWGPGGGGSTFELDDFSEDDAKQMNFETEQEEEEYYKALEESMDEEIDEEAQEEARWAKDLSSNLQEQNESAHLDNTEADNNSSKEKNNQDIEYEEDIPF